MLTKFAKLLSDERKLRLQNIELDVGQSKSWNMRSSEHMAHAHPILAIRVDYYKQLCVLHVLSVPIGLRWASPVMGVWDKQLEPCNGTKSNPLACQTI
jgi:hypothetical protein